jgi:hypothetical protein
MPRDAPDVEPWEETPSPALKPARTSRQRRPSFARMLKHARKLGIDMTVAPDGSMTLKCSGVAASPEADDPNPWDEVRTHAAD